MITFQYFDGCPHAQVTLDHLRAVADELGIPGTRIRLEKVSDAREAEAMGFQGSPTILVHGRDLTTGRRPEGFSYGCRVYTFGGKTTGVIPRDLIRRELAGYRREADP